MKWPTDRRVTKIQIPITRVCNRRCANCCARHQLTWFNPEITEREVSVLELTLAGDLIGEIEQLEITGGEPTLHSRFEHISQNLPDLFRCSDVMLVTNGETFRDESKLPLLLHYRRVYVTHYTRSFADHYGVEPNTEAFTRIEKYLEAHPLVQFWPQVMDRHVPYGEPPHGGVPCGQERTGMISYYEGRLYGCCVAWSLEDRGKSIPLTADWREHLTEIELPCETCFMSRRAA